MKLLRKVSPALLVATGTMLLACLPAAALDDEQSSQMLPILKTMPPIRQTASQSSPAPPAEPANIQAAARPVRHIYRNVREVKVPLDPRDATGLDTTRHQAVVLYVSGNRGRTWVRTQKRSLPATGLEFQAVNDGLYWCIFRGEPIASHTAAPPSDSPAELVVTVDTEGPEVKQLTAADIAEGELLEVAWEATDRSPLADVAVVAVQSRSRITFSPQQLETRKIGRARFAHLAPGSWRVTVSLADMAGNVTTTSCEVLVKAAPQVAEATPEKTADKLTEVAPLQPMVKPPGPTPATTPAAGSDDKDQASETETPPAAPAAAGDRQLEPTGQVLAREQIAVLGSRLLSIGYTWDTEHPPQRIGLWVTSDGGRTWKLDHVAERLTGTFVFQAPADGVYGFRTHRELGSSTWGKPQSGTAPEREIIVDTVSPKVEWIAPLAARSTETQGMTAVRVTGGRATLRWLAVDENLSERPARLDYRLFGKTRWQPLAADLPGEGSYQWSLPKGLSGQVEIRVTVADRAGQIAAADLRVKVVSPAQPVKPGPDTAAAKPDEKAIAEARRAYAMATLARLREDWSEAERQLKRATTLNPDYSRAWVDLGGVHAHNGHWDSAAADYTQAVELQPDNANALFGLARAQVARGDSGSAMRALESLLARRPTDGDALVLYGDLQWKSGHQDEARQSWLRALDAGGGSQAKLAAIERRLKLKH